MSIQKVTSSCKYIFRLPVSELTTSSKGLVRNVSYFPQGSHRIINLEDHKTVPTTFQLQCCPYSTEPDVVTTKESVLRAVSTRSFNPGNRITIVGVGSVGVACAFSILTQNVTSDLVLIDQAENRLQGEMLDLVHGSQYLKSVKISASTDYKSSADSRLCIVTSGARQNPAETRTDLLMRNVDVFKKVIPPLVDYSPRTVLLIVTNPVDILTYTAWKLSGLPSNRVIGSGTNLDSSRFRYLMSQKLGVSTNSCNGWIIGEHGDSSVAVWSGVNIATVNLKQINPAIGTDDDKENWQALHKRVVSSGVEIIKLKGYTCWAIGLSVSDIAANILGNRNTINAVSVLVKGLHGITNEVFLSLPAVLGQTGVTDILNQQLTDSEREALQKSAKLLYELQKKISI